MNGTQEFRSIDHENGSRTSVIELQGIQSRSGEVDCYWTLSIGVAINMQVNARMCLQGPQTFLSNSGNHGRMAFDFGGAKSHVELHPRRPVVGLR